MVKLNSVGSMLYTETFNVYPQNTDGTPDLDCGVYVLDCGVEWANSLSEEDLQTLNDMNIINYKKQGKNKQGVTMETVTLKLTKSEWTTIKETYLYHPIFLNEKGLLEIDDVDSFKEYLNDWINTYTDQDPTNQNLNNLKSILSKLQEVK